MAMVRMGASARTAVAVLVILQACSTAPAYACGATSDIFPRDGKCDGRESAGPRWDDNNTQVELLSQNLTVVLHPENHSISVTGGLRFKVNYDVGELFLWLYKTLNITRLESGGVPLNYARNATSDRITLSFAPRLLKGQVLDINCSYEGQMWVLEDGQRQDCVGWEGAHVKGSTHWYIMHHTSDWANYSLTFSCPPNWTAVADGDLAFEEHSAEWANFTWVTDRPCMRPAFAAGNYSMAGKTSGGINITAYAYPEHTALVPGYLDEAAKVMSAYSQILGAYGRKSFKIVETNHTTMTGYACSGFIMLYPGAFKAAAINYNLLSHETGHQWFPFLTGYIGWAYPWLWEAFPEYLSCVYEKNTYGSWARLDKDRAAFVAVHDDPGQMSIRSTGWDDPLSYQTLYAKGAWVLHMLRGLLGDTEFFSALKDYVTWNRYQMGSVDIFIAVAKGHSAFPLDAFFQQWLNTTFDLDASFSAARIYDNGTGFYLELEPVNLLCATSPADIWIQYADDTTQTLKLGWNGTAKLVSMAVPVAVSRVRLDPGGWLLDIDRTNNEIAPMKSGNIYDLQAISLDVPQNISGGQQAAITALVRNNSSYNAKAVRLELFMDGKPLANRSLDIPQGAIINSSVQWDAVEGRHNISVVVDSEAGFHEWDEANNIISVVFDVAPRPPRQDICVQNLTMDPQEPWDGDTVNFSAEVCNLGEAAVGPFPVQFYKDIKPLDSFVVPQLAPGASKTLSVQKDVSRGRHNFSVVADPLEHINESDESNNRAELSVFVRFHLDLALDIFPLEPMPGEQVSFMYSSGYGVEMLLDFGDGISIGWTNDSGIKNRDYHTYQDAGAYIVNLRGRSGGMEEETTFMLNVTARPIVLTVFANATTPLTLVPVEFSVRVENLSEQGIMERWDFGDDPSHQPKYDPTHIFARAGTYKVSCTITTIDGTVFASMNITVLDRPPHIKWDGPLELKKGQRASFSANGSDPDGNITLCSWDFGDGKNASGASVVHSFRKAGRFLVRVVAVDDSGSGAAFEQLVVVKEIPAPARPTPVWPLWLVPVAILVPAAGYILWRWNRRREREEEDFFSGRR
jgi:PKD repeat protein